MSKIKVTSDKSELEKIAENTKQLVDIANAENTTSEKNETPSEVKVSNIDVLLNAIGSLTNNINDNFKELNQNMVKSKSFAVKDTKEKTKKSSKTKTDDKLLKAVTDLNISLNSSFNNLAKILNEANKPVRKRRNSEELSIDKIKVEKEKALAAHQLKIQALNEKLIKSRLSFAEENHKRFLEKNYDSKSIATVPYRAYQNIQGQGSNALSATALSLMTGGIINPAMAKEFGLDKIVTAGTKFAGRTVAKATDTAWNMTGGLAWRNLSQPFTDPNSRLRQGMANGAKNVSSLGDNWVGLFNKDKETEGKTPGAVVKDKDKLGKIEKNTEELVKLASKEKNVKKQKKDKKEKSLLDKIFDAIGGMGLILKGAAVAAIPYVIKEFLPKATEWLDNKMKEFMSGTLGLSKSATEDVSQIIKDALPGALFGMTVNGWKGAIVGAGLSISYNWIQHKIDEVINGADEEKIPAKIGPFKVDTLEAAVSGAVIGSTFGWKGALLGAGIGVTGNWLLDQINDWHNIINGKGKKANSKELKEEMFEGALGGALIGLKFSWTGALLGALIGGILPLIKSFVSDAKGTIQMLKNGWAELKQFGRDMVAHPIDTFKKLIGFDDDEEEAIKESYEIGKAGKKPEEIKDPIPFEMIDITRPMMEEKYQQTFDPRTEEEKHQSLTPQRQAELDKTHAKVNFDYTLLPKLKDKTTFSQFQVKDTIETVINQATNDLSRLTPSQIYNFAAGDLNFDKTLAGAETTIDSLPSNVNLTPGFTYNTFDSSTLDNYGNSKGFEKLNKYTDVPWNDTIRRNKFIPDNIANNLNSIHDNVISPLQDAVGNHKVIITSSYRDKKYNADVGGVSNSKHLTGNAVDLVVNGLAPSSVINALQKAEIPFARAIDESSDDKHWTHLEYYPNGNNTGTVAKMVGRKYTQLATNTVNSTNKQTNNSSFSGSLTAPRTSVSSGSTAMASAAPASTSTSVSKNAGKASDAQGIKLETQSMPTAQESQTMAMNTMTETAQASAESTAASNDSILGLLDSMNGNIATTAMNTSNVTKPTGGIDSSLMSNMQTPQMSDMSISLPGNSGGNNKKDNTVYAFGDVAKTPILYTL